MASTCATEYHDIHLQGICVSKLDIRYVSHFESNQAHSLITYCTQNCFAIKSYRQAIAITSLINYPIIVYNIIVICISDLEGMQCSISRMCAKIVNQISHNMSLRLIFNPFPLYTSCHWFVASDSHTLLKMGQIYNCSALPWTDTVVS